MHNQVIVQRIDLDDILMNNRIKYNSNNHWNDERPLDYDQVISQCNTSKWVGQFKSNHKTFKIKKRDLAWMFKAFKIGSYRCKFPHMYDDELEEYLERNKHLGHIFDKPYFVRTNRNSLKNGVHGAGPYTDLKSVIESICTTTDTHTCFYEDDDECTVYLWDWKSELNKDREFRLFVHEKRLVAISQQHLYKTNEWLINKTDDEIKTIVAQINESFEKDIKPKIHHLTSYSVDFALVNDEGYFIEINSFGKEYASGSALFHWLIDEDIMYGKKEEQYFRFTI